MIDCKQNSGRLHEWDEENRLRFVLGEKFAGYYGYDANGERAFFIFRFQDIEIWRLFCFFLLYLKKVKVFHDFSCVFQKNIVSLQRILIERIQCREKNYIVEF